jgi:hypothetical protein
MALGNTSRCKARHSFRRGSEGIDRSRREAARWRGRRDVGSRGGSFGLKELAIGPEIGSGVPVLFTRSPKPVALALKSGNFGDPNFFSRGLSILKTGFG